VADAIRFDPATIAAMKLALDDAWNRLGPELQAQGERDYQRLRDAALKCIAAYQS
jgi:hypothetical protein